MLGSCLPSALFSLLAVIGGVCALVEPTAIYDGGFNDTESDILLRIAKGGAGQSGLVKGKNLAGWRGVTWIDSSQP